MISSVWNKLSWLTPIALSIAFRIAQRVVRLGSVVLTPTTEIAVNGYSVERTEVPAYSINVEAKVVRFQVNTVQIATKQIRKGTDGREVRWSTVEPLLIA